MTTAPSDKWYSFLPNFITLMNLVSGSIGVYFAFSNRLDLAFLFMLTGGLFDFVDGFMARLLKVSGDLGKQLDSLSDMVSFGLLPGVIVFSLQRSYLFENVGGFHQFGIPHWIYLLSALLVPMFSALRLGKFNIDTRQTDSFIGLPTPANAIFWGALAYTITTNQTFEWIYHPLIITILVVLFSYLLIAEIPLFSLKFKSFKGKENIIRYLFLLLSLVAIILFKAMGFSIAILLYFFLSVINNVLINT